MVDLEFKYGLPFCKIEVIHNNRRLTLNNVLFCFNRNVWILFEI
jgi:hypothetical protein